MPQAEYRFLLHNPKNNLWHKANAYDPILADLVVGQGQWDWGVNRAGQAQLEVSKESFQLANRDRQGTSETVVRQAGWKNTIPPAATTLWIHRNARPIWAGMVMDMSASGDSTTVQLVAEEFVGYYGRLRLSNQLSSNGTTQNVSTLVDALLHAEGTSSITMDLREGDPAHASPFIFSERLVNLITPPLNNGTYVPLWYEFENNKILDLINTLRVVGAGNASFEWRQGIERSGIGGWETRFTMYSPRMGRTRYAPVLEWGEGTAMNVKSMNWRYSAREMGTRITVTGAGPGDARLIRRRYNVKGYTNAVNSTPGSFQTLDVGAPLMDLVYSNDKLPSQLWVDYKCQDLLSRFAPPNLSVDVEMVPTNPAFYAVIDTPYDKTESFYEVEGPVAFGDLIPVRIVDGPLDLTTNLKVTSMGMRYQSGGDETLLMSLTPRFYDVRLMGLESGIPSTPANAQEDMWGSVLRRLDQLERRSSSTLRYGSGAPTVNDGNEGDTWLDTSSARYVYGPKGTSVIGQWSSIFAAFGNVGTDGLGQSYVPFVYQNVSVSHTGNSGRYLKVGKWVIGAWNLDITSSGSSGFAFAVTMPTVSQFSGNLVGGFGWHYDASAGVNVPIMLAFNSTTLITPIRADQPGGFYGTTLASGDQVNYVLIYAGTS